MFEKDAEIMSQYENYSVDELKDALKTLFLYSELNEQELAEMDEILTVLRKKEPIPHPHTTEEMWAQFQEDHAEELANLGIRENGNTEEVVAEVPENAVTPVVLNAVVSSTAPVRAKGHRRLFRVGMLAAAVVALMAIISVTAGAMGFNLWGWMPAWDNEQLSFEAEATPNNDSPVEGIASILPSLDITEPLYPTWLPKDLRRAYSIVNFDPLFLHESFHGNERELTITISPTSGSETAVYQKEGVTPLEYIAGNSIHYIFDNTTEVTAVWNTEHYTTLIVANTITIDEMKKIIDSLYEVSN